MKFSNNAVLIIDDRFYQNRIESELAESGVSLCSIPELSSFDHLKKKAVADGSLSFVKDIFSATLKSEGAPFIIVMNHNSNIFGTVTEDRANLLNTIILTYIILSFSRDFSDLHANFLIPYRSYEAEIVKSFQSNYQNIFTHIKGQGDAVKAAVEKFHSDKSSFDKLFTFNFISAESDADAFKTKIKLYCKAIEKRINFDAAKKESSPPEVDFEGGEITVYYRNDRDECILNGEPVDYSSDFDDIPVNEITVRGKWGTRNLRDANDKLIMTVGLLLESKQLAYHNDLKIFLRDECIVDGTIAASASNLMIKLFGRFKGSYLCVSPANEAILRRSPGYTLIRSQILRIDEMN